MPSRLWVKLRVSSRGSCGGKRDGKGLGGCAGSGGAASALTSGVSKICLTCRTLVMCHVYLEKVPRGSASLRTKAAGRNTQEEGELTQLELKS